MEKDKCSFATAVAEAAAQKESPLPKQKEILVPIDFSESSVNALRHVRHLAALEKARVVLLNVLEAPRSFRTLDVVGQKRALYGERAGRLQELADRELGAQVAIRIEVREGKPSVEIARLAGQRQVALVVVGRHPRHGLWHWVQGHTANRLLKNAPCAVLLLKADHHLN